MKNYFRAALGRAQYHPQDNEEFFVANNMDHNRTNDLPFKVRVCDRRDMTTERAIKMLVSALRGMESLSHMTDKMLENFAFCALDGKMIVRINGGKVTVKPTQPANHGRKETT